MVGKTKMKDWKAAVRTWEKNGYSNAPNNGAGDQKKRNATDDFMDKLKSMYQ